MQKQEFTPGKPKVVEHPELNPVGFDMRTHIKDAKTGQLMRVQPYRLHIINAVRYYERPVNSGNLFYESNEPAGRLVPTGEKDKAGKLIMKVDGDVAHAEYSAPVTENRTFAGVVDENVELRKELEALKAEKEASLKKAGAKPQPESPQAKQAQG